MPSSVTDSGPVGDTVRVTSARAAAGDHRQRWLVAVLLGASLGFWGLVLSRSILSVDDMGFIVRGSGLHTVGDVRAMLHHDVVVQNGRIADSVFSLVASAGEPAARAYVALACALLGGSTFVWLSLLVPRATAARLPWFAVPVLAAVTPFVLLGLDRRLIGQLVLFGAASSGYATGLFLVTVGLVPVVRAVAGVPVARGWAVAAAVPLVIGTLFHEVLAGVVAGAVVATAVVAVRRPDQRRRLLPLLVAPVVAVGCKLATPGLWSRAADSDQRQAAEESLLARADLALSFIVLALVPLLGFVLASVVLWSVRRGVAPRTLLPAAGAVVLLGVVSVGHRVTGGYPVAGVVVLVAAGVAVCAARAARPARVEPGDVVVLGAVAGGLALPVAGGLLPGRAWFFAEYLLLVLAVSLLARTVAREGARQPHGDSAVSGTWLASAALLGAGLVTAPALAFEMLDKVGDNHAWIAHVEAEVDRQRVDGAVEIPWTYPWDDMRPSFALDSDHADFEGLARAYFGIDDDVEVVWTGSVDWAGR